MARISRDVRSFLIIAIIVVVLGVGIVALIAKTTSGKSWTEINDPSTRTSMSTSTMSWSSIKLVTLNGSYFLTVKEYILLTQKYSSEIRIMEVNHGYSQNYQRTRKKDGN